MYKVICWRKDKKGNFIEYKILKKKKPYIKNAINIIHLPNNEFAFTSHSWPSLKIYKKDENENIGYTLLKDMRMYCSSKKNTLALYQDKILFICLEGEKIILFDVKNKEIISIINGINVNNIFIRKNGDIIIRECFKNFHFRPIINIYQFKDGEFSYKGVFEKKVQIYINEMKENDKGELFFIGDENYFHIDETSTFKIYLIKN